MVNEQLLQQLMIAQTISTLSHSRYCSYISTYDSFNPFTPTLHEFEVILIWHSFSFSFSFMNPTLTLIQTLVTIGFYHNKFTWYTFIKFWASTTKGQDHLIGLIFNINLTHIQTIHRLPWLSCSQVVPTRKGRPSRNNTWVPSHPFTHLHSLNLQQSYFDIDPNISHRWILSQ